MSKRKRSEDENEEPTDEEEEEEDGLDALEKLLGVGSERLYTAHGYSYRHGVKFHGVTRVKEPIGAKVVAPSATKKAKTEPLPTPTSAHQPTVPVTIPPPPSPLDIKHSATPALASAYAMLKRMPLTKPKPPPPPPRPYIHGERPPGEPRLERVSKSNDEVNDLHERCLLSEHGMRPLLNSETALILARREQLDEESTCTPSIAAATATAKYRTYVELFNGGIATRERIKQAYAVIGNQLTPAEIVQIINNEVEHATDAKHLFPTIRRRFTTTSETKKLQRLLDNIHQRCDDADDVPCVSVAIAADAAGESAAAAATAAAAGTAGPHDAQ